METPVLAGFSQHRRRPSLLTHSAVLPDRTSRIVRIILGVAEDLQKHEQSCGDWVAAIAFSPRDHAELGIVEIWGIGVVAWSDVEDGKYRLLCEAVGALIPHVSTFEELADRWAYDLRRPTPTSS